MLTYKVAELTGVDSTLTQALKDAAETGDPDLAAEAYSLFLDLPPPERQALALWLTESLQELPDYVRLAD
jgi:hypothetical protein